MSLLTTAWRGVMLSQVSWDVLALLGCPCKYLPLHGLHICAAYVIVHV